VSAASVTKTFVAAGILRLVERHEVELDASIARYLSPESLGILRSGGYDSDRMTVRQLLQHTAGLFDYAASDKYDAVNTSDPGHPRTRAEQLQFAVDHGDPVARPGTVFHARTSTTTRSTTSHSMRRTTSTAVAA
jgi:D-alanyl-D-alanine carboxypeptidase